MDGTGPSRTAYGAAAHRAVHQVLEQGRIFADPLAVKLFGDAQSMVREADEHPERYPMRIFIAARSRFAEDHLARSVAGGTRQVVILGAGLDTFAYRNPYGAQGVRVFEVDHPATQAWKLTVLDEARITVPPTTTYVPVDFETDDLAGELGRAGLDVRAPAYFVWLGVVPYLTTEAIFGTLRLIASIPGAAVVFDYPNPIEQLSADAGERHRHRAARVARSGEPWISYFDTDRLAADLAAAGLWVVDDMGPVDIAIRYFGAPADRPRRPGGHVVLAAAAP